MEIIRSPELLRTNGIEAAEDSREIDRQDTPASTVLYVF
jgi:hypothetical protein